MSTSFQDNFWLANCPTFRQYFRAQIIWIYRCNGRDVCDVFEVASKVQTFNQKLTLWQSTASICDFSDFECLHNFFQTINCETEDKPGMKNTTNCAQAFRCSTTKFRSQSIFQNTLIWIWIWFLCYGLRSPLQTRNSTWATWNYWVASDLIQKADFRTFINYPNFWVSLLSIPDYWNLSQKAIYIFVRMPLNYLCEEDFSAVVKNKSKKRNSMKNVGLEKTTSCIAD